MKKYKLQVYLEPELREKLHTKALHMGFSSGVDLTRFLIIGFCEDRVSVQLSQPQEENIPIKTDTSYDPYLISRKFYGLTAFKDRESSYLFDSVSADDLGDLTASLAGFGKVVKSLLGLKALPRLNYILLTDHKSLEKIAKEISGRTVKQSGCDLNKNIVYKLVVGFIKDETIAINAEVFKLLVAKNNHEECTNSVLITQLGDFVATYNQKLVDKVKLNYSDGSKKLHKKLRSLNVLELEDFTNTKADEYSRFLLCLLYNKLGSHNFKIFLDYSINHCNASLCGAVRECFHDEVINWLIDLHL